MGWFSDLGGVLNGINPFSSTNYLGSWLNASSDPGKDEIRDQLLGQGDEASTFAGTAQGNYNAMGAESQATRDYLRRVMEGRAPSLAGEQLRQGQMSNVAAQRAQAASASPANAAMAARNAAMNMGRIGMGLSGQQAMAGIAERNAAANQLGQMQLGARGQDVQAALGSRGNAINAYSGGMGNTTPNNMQAYGLPILSGIGGMLLSDRRQKTAIKSGEREAERAVEGLRAYVYKYKGKQYGEGKQLGVMAQDLERVGLGHTVVETPAGKAVHGGKLAGALAAILPGLARRVTALEGKEK